MKPSVSVFQIKGLDELEAEESAQLMRRGLKLDAKANFQSRTLSGGMKRKLSVGIALCAGSKVCGRKAAFWLRASASAENTFRTAVTFGNVQLDANTLSNSVCFVGFPWFGNLLLRSGVLPSVVLQFCLNTSGARCFRNNALTVKLYAGDKMRHGPNGKIYRKQCWRSSGSYGAKNKNAWASVLCLLFQPLGRPFRQHLNYCSFSSSSA